MFLQLELDIYSYTFLHFSTMWIEWAVDVTRNRSDFEARAIFDFCDQQCLLTPEKGLRVTVRNLKRLYLILNSRELANRLDRTLRWAQSWWKRDEADNSLRGNA